MFSLLLYELLGTTYSKIHYFTQFALILTNEGCISRPFLQPIQLRTSEDASYKSRHGGFVEHLVGLVQHHKCDQIHRDDF